MIDFIAETIKDKTNPRGYEAIDEWRDLIQIY